ncbi:MAG: hypothetical protein NC038_03440 [Paludibacter sp.]|nr:hypothetical protein [Bacteroidales bacterium]MCM1069076.1 hypothetical protein [Prevotella sp.]MCM1353515.1 hypothetical protein [Bacteroides sp.]MCM1442676.1 hypothetical protein [Muribaculum sp.]MCM1481688.1 hypothetical protein [Paludibacter sp.]
MKSRLATAMSIFGCSLLVAAFIVKPTGEIHSSVLTAFASTLTYSAALFGINMKENNSLG